MPRNDVDEKTVLADTFHMNIFQLNYYVQIMKMFVFALGILVLPTRMYKIFCDAVK